MTKRTAQLIFCLLAAGPMIRAIPATPPAPDSHSIPIDFQRDIQPIFAATCHSCHGPEKQKGGLRLDRKIDALRGGDSGPVIDPGKALESKLYRFVAGLDPETVMPPKGERLDSKQIARIKSWIDAGAAWPEIKPPTGVVSNQVHWSFRPAARPPVPSVRNRRWVRNPIDTFILERLEQEKVQPAPEAGRRSLIRRLSLDLLGLPPAPAQVAAFLADKRQDAYERLVDQLLVSPHYGERWARHWLDLARYADSDGYEKDTVRPYAWLYRDWTINALNRDLPFDRFTLEQLAGDLLPDATRDQKIATGFHRNTLTNKEGGVDQEEFRCKAVVDRVNTTGATWLGLTVGCAECHTHKYDPITQREYYQLFAFFNAALEQNIPAPQPAELAQFQRDKEAWETRRAQLAQQLEDHLKSDFAPERKQWERQNPALAMNWVVLIPLKASADQGATLEILSDHSILATNKNPAKETYTIEVQTGLSAITGFRLEVFDDPAPARGVGRSQNGNFVLNEFGVKTAPPSDSASGQADRLGPSVEAPPAESAITLRRPTADFADEKYPVFHAVDGDAKTGWSVNGQQDERHVAVFETDSPLDAPAGRLIVTLDQQFGSSHSLGRFRLSATTDPPPLNASRIPDSIDAILDRSPSERSTADESALTRYYRDEVDSTTLKLKRLLARHAREEPSFPETKAQTLARNPELPATHIHVRGDFLRKGDAVQPGTPAVLHAFQPRGAEGESDRLDLARWLMDPANPLTARVTVNRIWHHLFGRGLVATVDDFGTRGELPTHPELLDWLAAEFPRLGWSQKAIIKLIVTSAAYRQSSRPRPELFDRDPLNQLLARQNRFRLEAETVRDAFLASSGLLNFAVGGPGVRPPLPADIAAVGYANSIKWKESDGADRYRRGLYIFFQRTVPYPMLVAFDAPDSNVTCTRRERSNTPLQALTLLNGPVFFECAQTLGRRLAAEPESGRRDRFRLAFESCLARAPSGGELARLDRLFGEQLNLLSALPESAARISGLNANDPRAAETAAWIIVARTVMNLDEFVTRE